jgi:hypothetical protein
VGILKKLRKVNLKPLLSPKTSRRNVFPPSLDIGQLRSALGLKPMQLEEQRYVWFGVTRFVVICCYSNTNEDIMFWHLTVSQKEVVSCISTMQ